MTFFLFEVGYKKHYKKTLREQHKIIQEYETPSHIQNTWKNKLHQVARIVTLWGLTNMLGRNLIDYIYKQRGHFVTLAHYSEKVYNNAPEAIAIWALVSIPFSGENHPIFYIPLRNNDKIRPAEAEVMFKNKLFNPQATIEFNLDKKEYDSIIHSIAQEYNAVPVHNYEDRENSFLIYKFDGPIDNIVNNVKRFLFSLPPNVFVKGVYRISDDVTKINKKKEKKIYEYVETHSKYYAYFNKNKKYLWFFNQVPFEGVKHLLPEKYKPPKWSPMQNSIRRDSRF